MHKLVVPQDISTKYDIENAPRYYRALLGWRHRFGRQGLSHTMLCWLLHEPDYEVLLNRIKEDKLAFAGHCSVVNASLWFTATFSVGNDTVKIVPPSPVGPENVAELVKQAKAFPYPKYGGMHNNKGVLLHGYDDIMQDVTLDQRKLLRHVIRGTEKPWNYPYKTSPTGG